MKLQIEKWVSIILIFLLTFPLYSVEYGIGLDTSYIWGLNWLFVNDYATLKQLIYPFGPLAFLKIPTVTGYNLIISIGFYTLLKLGFLWLLFKLSDITQNTGKYSTILIIFCVSFFTNIDFLFWGCCLILNFIFYKTNNIILFIISVLLAFIGLFVKVSIGITTLSIIGVSVLIHLYYSKNITHLAKQMGIIVGVGFVTGILVFGKITTYFRFLMGVYKLQEGYGDTLSLHPDNNWLLLVPFLIIMAIFPFICKEKDTRITYLLSLFSLFAVWKHSLIREDNPHYSILVTFLFVFWGIIFIISSKKSLTLLAAGITILLVYANMSNIPMYSGIKRDIAGINNFKNVLDYSNFKQKMLSMSERNVSKNRLETEIRNMIGDKTVDVYPWEFSFISANQLQWKPRKTVEIGASTSRWASEKASENYLLSENSPEFVIFHLPNDYCDGKFGSLDQRHILNDEPLLIFNLLNNYTLSKKNNQILLFKRDTISHFEDVYSDEYQNYNFGDWIDIPYHADEITRLKVFSKNTFLGKLNKAVSKETAYYIDYQLENGIILTYRYVPNTAVDGLWCNPLIRYPNTDIKEPKVIKVRLRNANSHCVKKSFKAQFQHINLKPEYRDSKGIEHLLFHKNITPSQEVFVDLLQQSGNELSRLNGFSSTVNKGFSYTYIINLDSLFNRIETDSLIIEANVRALNCYHGNGLVISTHETQEDFWKISYLPTGISKDLWHYIYLNKTITRERHASGILKAYILNSGTQPIYIDDFRLCISHLSHSINN